MNTMTMASILLGGLLTVLDADFGLPCYARLGSIEGNTSTYGKKVL